MYLVNLEAHPKPDSDAYGTVSGAQAVCWVNTHDASEAERIVRETLAKSGWDTEDIEEIRPVVREDFMRASVSLDRFDQALQDGIAVTLHKWPVGAPDE